MRLNIDNAPLPRKAPGHSLLDAAVDLTPADRHWEGGITWDPEDGCATIQYWDPTCGVVQDDKEAVVDLDPGLGVFTPFVIYTTVECQVTPKNYPMLVDQVRNRLEAGTPKALEYEFWSGSMDLGNFSLAGSTPNADGTEADACGGILNQTYATPVAVNPEVALLQLGQALANCGTGARGVLHAPAYLAETWALRRYVVEDENGVLRTRGRGDVVVVGSGYPGTGPNGNGSATPTSGTSWAYATGPIGVLLGEIFFPSAEPEVVNRATNVVRVTAERHIGIVADPNCNFATYVDVP